MIYVAGDLVIRFFGDKLERNQLHIAIFVSYIDNFPYFISTFILLFHFYAAREVQHVPDMHDNDVKSLPNIGIQVLNVV